MTKLLVLLALVGCSKSDETKPGSAAADPWASSAPAADPWAQKSADTPQPASTLAGSYQCMQLRYGTAVNGMRQSTYVASALGVFEIDGDGTYRSESYPAQGTGRAQAAASDVRFDGGPYAGSVGVTGTTSSGSFHIRFSENRVEAPAPSLQFNDHMCYRQ